MANIIQVDIVPFTGYGMYFFNAEPNQFVPTLVSQCLTSHVLEQTLILAKTLTSDPYKAGLLKTRIIVARLVDQIALLSSGDLLFLKLPFADRPGLTDPRVSKDTKQYRL